VVEALANVLPRTKQWPGQRPDLSDYLIDGSHVNRTYGVR
jgi:hypothetical protein